MTRPRVCILLNSHDEFDFEEILQRHLPPDRFDVSVTVEFPDQPTKFALIVPWSYQKVIKGAEAAGNIVVLHSSDLPDGRGWAPIYHVFRERKSEHVICGILAADAVDSGNIIVRARFPIAPGYTAPFARRLDEELSLLLIATILDIWPKGRLAGVEQSGTPSYRARRRPEDNAVDTSLSLEDLLPHLRGTEADSPAFFVHGDVKYLIEVRPATDPIKPAEVTIEYPALDKAEIWRGWA